MLIGVLIPIKIVEHVLLQLCSRKDTSELFESCLCEFQRSTFSDPYQRSAFPTYEFVCSTYKQKR